MKCVLRTAIAFLIIANFSSGNGFSDVGYFGRRHQHMMYDPRSQFGCPQFKDTFLDKIGVVLLPSGDVCVRGKKLRKAILSDDPWTQIQILKGIAIWFSPCNYAAAGTDVNQCVMSRRNVLSKLNTTNISSLHKLAMNSFGPNLLKKVHYQSIQDTITM